MTDWLTIHLTNDQRRHYNIDIGQEINQLTGLNVRLNIDMTRHNQDGSRPAQLEFSLWPQFSIRPTRNGPRVADQLTPTQLHTISRILQEHGIQ